MLSSGDLPLRSIQSLPSVVTAAHEAAAGHGSWRRQPDAPHRSNQFLTQNIYYNAAAEIRS